MKDTDIDYNYIYHFDKQSRGDNNLTVNPARMISVNWKHLPASVTVN